MWNSSVGFHFYFWSGKWNMNWLENLRTHWNSLGIGDLFSVICVFIVMLITIVCNVLFTNFIESKPSGRKTVIGKISPRILYKITAGILFSQSKPGYKPSIHNLPRHLAFGHCCQNSCGSFSYLLRCCVPLCC